MLSRKPYSSQMDESGRSVPKQPPPLMGKALPNLNGIKVDFAPEQAKGKMILICFFDIQQRPSRYCLRQLSTRA
jgi:hypothetical protein